MRQVQVRVDVEDMIRNVRNEANQALLTFVSLGEDRRPQQVWAVYFLHLIVPVSRFIQWGPNSIIVIYEISPFF